MADWRGGRRAWIESADPVQLYQGSVVALTPEGPENNGQPSLHAPCFDALCLDTLRLRGGCDLVHVGAGTGYYTALLAIFTGPSGRGLACEIAPDLAARGVENLRDWPPVRVFRESGAAVELPPRDAIYVSAGATEPVPEWLDALRIGGRLLFPLTAT